MLVWGTLGVHFLENSWRRGREEGGAGSPEKVHQKILTSKSALGPVLGNSGTACECLFEELRVCIFGELLAEGSGGGRGWKSRKSAPKNPDYQNSSRLRFGELWDGLGVLVWGTLGVHFWGTLGGGVGRRAGLEVQKKCTKKS